MQKFEAERKQFIQLNTSTFKHFIPMVVFSPKIISDDSCVFLFLTGLGSTIPSIEILNYPFFDKHYLVAYEKAGHGQNTNAPKRFKSFFLNEVDEVVNKIRSMYPNRKLFIIGESWGSALGYLYTKKHYDKIDGVFCWNMPYIIKDASHSSWKERMNIFWKMLLTIPFGIPTKDYHPKDTSEVLSSNAMLIRLAKLANANKVVDMRLYLASWWSFKPAWRFINKHFDDSKYKMFYVQTGEDFMKQDNNWNKFQKKFPDSKRWVYFDKGYHILSTEEPWNQNLFKFITDNIN